MKTCFFVLHQNAATVRNRCWCHAATLLACFVLCVTFVTPTNAQGAKNTGATTTTSPLSFAVRLGDVVSLRDGTRVLATEGQSAGASLHTFENGTEHVFMTRRANADGTQFSDLADSNGVALPGTTISQKVQATRDGFTLRQNARAARNVMGVSWSVRGIPLSFNILVPGESGKKLTRSTSQATFQFDYPLGWEAGIVIVEGQGGGFSVRSEEAKPHFKKLIVKREPNSWTLTFLTLNQAPFADKTSCESVPWRLQTYRGDWRVAAKTYRDAMAKRLVPQNSATRKPAWAREIRAFVIMEPDVKELRVLATKFDPRQTMLYLPTWRADGYDRNYPEYSRVVPPLKAFMKAAQSMGFRVMLHVNYFGVDLKHPLYQKFAKYHMREPLGNHELQWWWPARDMGLIGEDIQFAYINPASREWRALFVARMEQLARDYSPDALHLDQTLVMTNDNNGLIDGMNSMEGSLALHRALRVALPNVALSGEGLDEITAPYEAFAQRHVSGINFLTGGYDRTTLAMAHGISSYLLRPYTTIYGYLGMVPPASGQVYAAWQQPYRHWGVIPTIHSMGPLPDTSEGFTRQFFDEVKLFQGEKLDADVDGIWTKEVAFPFRTARGERAFYTEDGRLIWRTKSGDKTISRTVTNVERLATRGTIASVGTYNATHIFGLDKARWYPLINEPRDLKALHVSTLPKDVRAQVSTRGGIGMVSLSSAPWTVSLTDSQVLARAQSGFMPMDGGAPVLASGALASSSSGAQFAPFGDTLFSHPAWQKIASGETRVASDANAGKLRFGSSFLRFRVQLPTDSGTRFISEISMGEGSVGEKKTDGVIFRAIAHAENYSGAPISVEGFSDTTQHQTLTLDLTPLAGRKIILELQADPGEKSDPTFDWSRWYNPRIERVSALGASRAVPLALGGKLPWKIAFSGTRATARAANGAQNIQAELPGTAFLLQKAPAAVSLPLDFTKQALRPSYEDENGTLLPGAPIGPPTVGTEEVGGTMKPSLNQHPPHQGRTVLLFPMTLPKSPAQFVSSVRLRDGSRSTGVVFQVLVNGLEVMSQRMLPGDWREVEADLSAWAGKPVVISLITDSNGSYNYDWALWGAPMLREMASAKTP